MIKQPVTAAGGILYRKKKNKSEAEVVMIYRWGKWDLPKGKWEKGETVEDCARREVSEELGIPKPEIITVLSTTYHEYERDGKLWGKTTHWFAMISEAAKFTPQVKEDIEKAKWIPISEAVNMVGYDTLRPLLLQMKEWLNKQ